MAQVRAQNMSNQNLPETLERARARIRTITTAADAHDVTFLFTQAIGYLEALEAEKLVDEETSRLLGAELDQARRDAPNQQLYDYQ